jgi:hypothetical protein
LFFADLILDLGQFMQATRDLSPAYWFGVVLILLRRSNTLTPGDRLFMRFGLIPILVIGIPILLYVWSVKRVL